MDMTQAGAGYVVLSEEADIMRAQWLAGAIEGAGIPVHVEENGLADEFAMSQKLMGIQRVRVLVPHDRLDEAKTVFLNLSQPIPLVDDDEDEIDWEELAEKQRSMTSTRALILILVLLGVPAAVILTWQAFFSGL